MTAEASFHKKKAIQYTNIDIYIYLYTHTYSITCFPSVSDKFLQQHPLLLVQFGQLVRMFQMTKVAGITWAHRSSNVLYHTHAVSLSNCATVHQWLFLVPVKGGRWHIIPQLAVYTTYISLIYCLLGGYMLPTTFYGNQKQPLNTGYYTWNLDMANAWSRCTWSIIATNLARWLQPHHHSRNDRPGNTWGMFEKAAASCLKKNMGVARSKQYLASRCQSPSK